MNFSRPSTKDATRRRKTGSSGFTLLELLVSITIFSLVIGMAMYSLRFSFGVFRHLDAPFAEDTQRISRLTDCIDSTFVYVGERSGDMFNHSLGFYTYFTGEADNMTFVSTKPVAGTGLSICRLSLHDGSVFLDEAPIYAEDNDYLNPSLDTKEKRSTAIFPHATGLKLDYYQGETKLSVLKEDLPTLVHMVVTTDEGEREYFCRLQSDFVDKKTKQQGIHNELHGI